MSSIPTNIILIWPGTVETIPTGWTRVTELDGKFIKGSLEGVNPNVTGGQDTHTHTSPTHTHTLVNHTHSGNTARSTNDYESHGGNSANSASQDFHYHTYTTDGISGGALSSAITYQAASSLPPFHEVIFIKPTSLPVGLPDGVVTLYGTGNIPTNWDICDGEDDTPDLNGKYLRGSAADQDAGETGGATTHEHEVDHGHGSVNHSHTAGHSAVGNSTGTPRDRDNFQGGGSVVDINHKHIIYLNNASDTPANYTGDAGSAETVEPAHALVRAIQNNSGANSKPRGIIGLWLGSLATIPKGWFLCDGENDTPDLRGYYTKITESEEEVGDTAGQNTHTHAASNSHTHTAAGSHTHTGYSGWHNSVEYATGAVNDGASKPHSHASLDTCDSKTSTWNAATIQADESSNEPAHRTVAFIMFKYETYGGAAILSSVLVN